MEREVIVVGAGPAGAATAAALAQKGRDVLLLDRKAFPRDKACGDAVPAGAIEILYRLGMKDLVEAAVDREEFYKLKSMRLVSPMNLMFEAEFHQGQMGADSYVAPRLYFDDVVQKGAVRAGAEFKQAQVKEPIVEDGRVVGVRARVNGDVKEIRSRVVVGADGVTSVVTRNIRPKDNQHIDRHRAVALRAYIDDLEIHPEQVEFYLYRKILPGYAWIFPTSDGTANIGLGMRLDHFRDRSRSLNEMLDDFLAMPAIKTRLKNGGQVRDVATWQLNFGSQKDLQHVFDGAILVGDAAGFINPITGGGIHNALMSACLAAANIDRALGDGDVSRDNLVRYEGEIHEAMWTVMRRSYLYQRAFNRLPFLVDFLVKTFGQSSSLAQTFLTKL